MLAVLTRGGLQGDWLRFMGAYGIEWECLCTCYLIYLYVDVKSKSMPQGPVEMGFVGLYYSHCIGVKTITNIYCPRSP